MKRFFLVLILALCLPIAAMAQGQNFPGGSGATFVTANPATCTVGQVFYNTTTGQTLYCTALNTLSASPTGANTLLSQLPASGLTSLYLLTDATGTTTKDFSGSGNNGTFAVSGSPTWGTSPQFGLTCSAAGTQAVVLPAALNGTKTWFAFVDTTANVGTFNGIFVGNGTPPASAMVFTAATTTGLQTGGNNGLGGLESQSNGGTATTNFVPVLGAGLLTVTFDTIDHHFVNGVEVPNYSAIGTSAGAITSGSVQLCGAAAGQGFGLATYNTGKIYLAATYSRVLSAAEISTASQAILAYMAQNRGLATASFNSIRSCDQIITVGDSQTSGTGVTTPWPSLIVPTNGAWCVVNAGSSGRTMVGFSKGEVQENFPIKNPNPARNMEIILAGTNDIAISGLTGAQTEQAAESFNVSLRSQQIPTAMCTMISRTGFDTGKNAYNVLLRQYSSVFSNSLCDFGMNPSIGGDGASTNPIYDVGDGVHPSQTAHDSIMAPMAQAALNHIHGNVTQSAATVYTTGTLAAVNTTAVTESGNLVTVTMAATPANCQQGNLAILAGVTSTTYNTTVTNGYGLGGGFIRSRTATTITMFNPTSGLGNATVQGTVVCPQQQDNDQYIVLNSGAPFSLQSCELWASQTITIKNINAAASTINPWTGLSELIDGRNNITVAPQSTVQLTPVLVSAAAGGCNWKSTPVTNVGTFSQPNGSGAGNYTGANTTYANVDTTNLCSVVTVPLGWKLNILASGSVTTSTAVATASVSVSDIGTTCGAGGVTPLKEIQVNPTVAGTAGAETFTIPWLLTGDGNAHAISMQAKTSAGADSWLILNSSATLSPSINLTLSPSN